MTARYDDLDRDQRRRVADLEAMPVGAIVEVWDGHELVPAMRSRIDADYDDAGDYSRAAWLVAGSHEDAYTSLSLVEDGFLRPNNRKLRVIRERGQT